MVPETIPLMIIKKGDDIMADETLNPYKGAYTGPQMDEVIGQILSQEYIGRSVAIKERCSEAEPYDLDTLTTHGIHYIEYYKNDYHTNNEVRPFYPIYVFVTVNENTGIISQRYQAYNETWYTRYIDALDSSSYEWTIDDDYYKTLADTIIEYSDIEAIPKFKTLEDYETALNSGDVKDLMCIVEEEKEELDYTIVYPYLGENKNWWILGKDTGIKAIMEAGVDYFTEEDKAEIVEDVLNSDKITSLINNVTSISINDDEDLVIAYTV